MLIASLILSALVLGVAGVSLVLLAQMLAITRQNAKSVKSAVNDIETRFKKETTEAYKKGYEDGAFDVSQGSVGRLTGSNDFN